MRSLMPCLIVTLALAVIGCGENNKPAPTEPPKSPSTSQAVPTDPPPASGTTQPVAADNTGRNAKDDSAALTPLDQGMSEKDVALTQAVRKAVVAHKGLSVNAQNVKIIAKDGVVTLRGPVESESERTTIVTMAEQVPEVHTVINHLEIASR